jgi:hypothetical protein
MQWLMSILLEISTIRLIRNWTKESVIGIKRRANLQYERHRLNYLIF